MKKLKENKGFTLVELIVVIAILGILAAVAVPAYSGYVTKAKDAKVLSEVSTLVTGAQSVATADGATVTEISISSAGVITVTTSGGPSGYDLDESKIADYLTNVESTTSNNTTTTSVKNWSKVVEGSSYNGKTVKWESSTLEWKAS